MIDTKKLKAFAAAARAELIAEVKARINVVLAAASPDRIEAPAAIKALEGDIRRHGGDAKGKQHVAEEQAYLWFNRIVAFRFMDVNGYTLTPVVSPDGGRAVGQPAVLTAAKRGEFDPEVFGNADASNANKKVVRITGLLNGSISSYDRDGEAYGLILSAYCAFWHKAMPFMFGREGEYTNLLMPAALLAIDSVLAQTVATLTADDCQDVEVIGWLYQYYIARRKDEVFASFKKGGKAGADEIPAATQLFTPDWIVRYLVQNSVGRLWMLNHPESRLIEQMEYYIDAVRGKSELARSCEDKEDVRANEETEHIPPVDESPSPDSIRGEGCVPPMETLFSSSSQSLSQSLSPSPDSIRGEEATFLKINKPEELTVMDPACGSGHMLTYAFDLLYAIYEEEGYASSDIPKLILTHNLFGTEIDERAGSLAAFALTMKARAKQRTFFRAPTQPNICVIRPVSFELTELIQLTSGSGGSPDMEDFWNCFAQADTRGSLIQPDADVLPAAKAQVEALCPVSLDESATQDKARCVLTQVEYLARRYAVIVANPPYMGAKNMDAGLAEYLKKQFPEGKADLFAAFICRNLDLAISGGMVAMITMHSWMFLTSYEKLRRSLLTHQTIASMLHLGARAFDSIGGEVVSSTAFVLQNSSASSELGSYVRLVDGNSETEKVTLLEAALQTKTSQAGVGAEAGTPSNKPDMAKYFFRRTADYFQDIPGTPIVYWLSDAMRGAFKKGKPLGEIAEPRSGLTTGVNARFLREWWEVGSERSAFGCLDRESASATGARWFPHNKGGEFRKWYGNHEHVLNWQNDGKRIRELARISGSPHASVKNADYYFLPSASWSRISSGDPAFREYPVGFVFDDTGTSIFTSSTQTRRALLGISNSSITLELLKATAPTVHFEVGAIAKLPILLPSAGSEIENAVGDLIRIAKEDWNSAETSWEFTRHPLLDGLRCTGRAPDGIGSAPAGCDSPVILGSSQNPETSRSIQHPAQGLELSHADKLTLSETVASYIARSGDIAAQAQQLEQHNNELVAELYGMTGEVEVEVPLAKVSLTRNTAATYSPNLSEAERCERFTTDLVKELLSYAVGCMFGRYSLDEPGLILASQGETLQDYLTRIPNPSFEPDADGVIPITGGEWFSDDIVARFRQFLRVAFGDAHFAENLRFIEQALGKSLRQYFLKDFYKDHIQRYSNRPIYWMFSSQSASGKGVFNALVYLHRYTPATPHLVLNEYLREFQAKLRSEIVTLEKSDRGADLKQADAHRKALLECEDYERDVLFPLASRNLLIDLDDGVLVNYLRLGQTLVKIPAIEKKRRDVATWTWPKNPLTR